MSGYAVTCPQCLGLRVVPFYPADGEVLRPAHEHPDKTPVRIGNDLMVYTPGELAPVRGTCGSMVKCPKCDGMGEIRAPKTDARGVLLPPVMRSG